MNSIALIWLFVAGWAHVITGSFPAMGIAMTIVVGVASAAEIAGGLSWRTTTSPRPALGLTAASLAAQILAMYVSVLYPIAHR